MPRSGFNGLQAKRCWLHPVLDSSGTDPLIFCRNRNLDRDRHLVAIGAWRKNRPIAEHTEDTAQGTRTDQEPLVRPAMSNLRADSAAAIQGAGE